MGKTITWWACKKSGKILPKTISRTLIGAIDKSPRGWDWMITAKAAMRSASKYGYTFCRVEIKEKRR